MDSFSEDPELGSAVMLQRRPLVLSGFTVIRVAFGGPSRRFLGSTA